MTNEREHLSALGKIIERAHGLAFAHCGKLDTSGQNAARCKLEIGLNIAATDDPLLRLKIDQDQRPLVEEPDLGYNRACRPARLSRAGRVRSGAAIARVSHRDLSLTQTIRLPSA